MEKIYQEGYLVAQIIPGVWVIDDETDATCYLIPGEKSALLIDTAWGKGDLKKVLSELTDLPIVLAVTHAHADHCAKAMDFEKALMHPADIAMLRSQAVASSRYQGEMPSWDHFTPVRDGDCIDIGGNSIEVIEVPGHTPGSLVFLDRKHRAIFTGDAIGSGGQLWMQVEHAIPLEEYLPHVKRLADILDREGELTYLGGHILQAGEPDTPECHPIDRQYVEDVITVCEDLVAGKPLALEQFEYPPQFNRSVKPGEAMIANRGYLHMVFRPDSVRA